MIAIIEAYKSGCLSPKHWWPNILSGLLVGVVALPLAMAFAIASGATPQQGIYTAIIAAIVTGLFGGTRTQISGPTGAFVIILASTVAKYGIDGLQIASLMAGIILLIMGFLKLGNVVKFIPDPVVIGFTTGIGIIIFTGEWKDFFGLSVSLPLDASFIQKMHLLIQALPSTHLPTLALSLLSLFLILFSPKLIKKLPGPLVAMVVVTILQMVFHFDHVATIGSVFGNIPQQLPELQVPSMTLSRIFVLMGPAFTIALLGAIESLLSATAADAMAGTRHQSNQELIGQGLANMLTPLFGGFAATGAIARTATNIRNGGTNPISAIVHSSFLVLVLMLLAPAASQVPLCVLAAILFVVSYNMSDIPHFFYTLKAAPKHDAAILLITCLLTVFSNLVVAVYIGMTLSLLFFLQRTNIHMTISSHTKNQLHHNKENEVALAALPEDVLVHYFEGPFFFGTARKIEQALAVTYTNPKVVILNFKEVPFVDATGLFTLKKIIQRYQARQISIYLCNLNSLVQKKLINAGYLKLLPPQCVCHSMTEAIDHIAKMSCPAHSEEGSGKDAN